MAKLRTPWALIALCHLIVFQRRYIFDRAFDTIIDWIECNSCRYFFGRVVHFYHAQPRDAHRARLNLMNYFPLRPGSPLISGQLYLFSELFMPRAKKVFYLTAATAKLRRLIADYIEWIDMMLDTTRHASLRKTATTTAVHTMMSNLSRARAASDETGIKDI